MILGIELVEIMGYLASLGVLLSFLMKDIKKLRVVNTIGCTFFIIYGFMLQTAWPIVITNVTIVLINLYYLFIKTETKVS